MDTIIVTCDRTPNNYLWQTVSHLMRQGLSPKIQHGSFIQNNLQEIPKEDLSRLKVSILPESTKPEFMELDIRPRHNKNYAAAFLLGDKNTDALILEDDVMPCKNLQKQLDAVYWLIKKHQLDKYAIALYSHYKWPLSAQNLHEYPNSRFFGLQAILYSANVRETFRMAHEALCDKEPADFITRIVAKENGLLLYATTFSLFQHMGQVTTGLGNFHYAENFLDGTN